MKKYPGKSYRGKTTGGGGGGCNTPLGCIWVIEFVNTVILLLSKYLWKNRTEESISVRTIK